MAHGARPEPNPNTILDRQNNLEGADSVRNYGPANALAIKLNGAIYERLMAIKDAWQSLMNYCAIG